MPKEHSLIASLIMGRKDDEGDLKYGRRLLSQYDVSIGLEKYVPYHALKQLIHEIRKARKALKQAAADDTGAAEARLISCIDTFESELIAAITNVSATAKRADEILLSLIRTVEGMNDTQVREDRATVMENYLRIRSLSNYRDLSIEGFKTLLGKFVSACGLDSLQIQRRAESMYALLQTSSIYQCAFDVAEAADYLLRIDFQAMQRADHSWFFEKSVRDYQVYCSRDLDSCERIVPIQNTQFYTKSFPHRQQQGHFALRVLTGNAAPRLAKQVTGFLRGQHMVKTAVGAYANGEVSINFVEPVRGDDVFIIQPLTQTRSGKSLSTVLMELLLLSHTAQLATAKRVTLVVPYMAYTLNTFSISAVAKMITTMGAHHVITVDLARGQVAGMFGNIPVENLSARSELCRYVGQNYVDRGYSTDDLVIVSPDALQVDVAKQFADRLTTLLGLSAKYMIPLVHAVKRQNAAADAMGKSFPLAGRSPTSVTPPTEASEMKLGSSPLFPGSTGASPEEKRLSAHRRRSFLAMQHPVNPEKIIDIIGEVEDKRCIVVDSVIDGGTSLSIVSEMLMQCGAKSVSAVATHGLFSPGCASKLTAAPLDEIVVTDSIDNDELLIRHPGLAKKLRIVPLSPLIARAIERLHTDNDLVNMGLRTTYKVTDKHDHVC